MLADINQLDFNKKYTYADYLTWNFDEMVELIKGKIFKMSPAPGVPHQWTSGELFSIIHHYCKNKKCHVFSAPFDVRLPLLQNQKTHENADTVVQPDVCVICDLSKLDIRGCKGAPDWIIEILSKGTTRKDLNDKFDVYQNAGVLEYWIVHPLDQTVIPYRLDENGEYQTIRKTPFVRGQEVPVGIFPGFSIPLDEIFTDLEF